MSTGVSAAGAQKSKFKVIFLGNINVGKSSLIIRYVVGDFEEGESIDFDSKSKVVDTSGQKITLLITDTAGQERFRSLTSSYYRNADVVIIVYDVTNEESFDEVERFLKEACLYGSANADKYVVGNKSDRDAERVVTAKMLNDLKEQFDVPFFETSAKSGAGVEELFACVCETLATRMNGGGSSNATPTQGTLSLTGAVAPPPKKKSGGCVLV